MVLDVSKILVIEGRGPDKICIYVNKQDPCWPHTRNGLVLSVNAATGTGADYVKREFGIVPEVLKLKDNRIPFGSGPEGPFGK